MNPYIIGIDEVGRGPIAGPVAVCVCMLKKRDYDRILWDGLTDSKKMTALAREKWYKKAQCLKQEGMLAYTVIYVSPLLIDTKGIAWALRSSIAKGLKKLTVDETAVVLLDGSLRAPAGYRYQQTIIKGDQKEKIISLASVIAKVTRDAYMVRLHKRYPFYGWDRNKGYGTKEHYRALNQYGRTPLHRATFLGDKKKYK
jgi:ribonuclease HII